MNALQVAAAMRKQQIVDAHRVLQSTIDSAGHVTRIELGRVRQRFSHRTFFQFVCSCTAVGEWRRYRAAAEEDARVHMRAEMERREGFEPV